MFYIGSTSLTGSGSSCASRCTSVSTGCTSWLRNTWSISADLSPASTATNISYRQIMVNCRFLGSGCQLTEDVLLDMPVHLLGTLFQTVLNAAHTFCLPLDAISNNFTSRFTSTPSPFEVITANALYKLLTYLSLFPRFFFFARLQLEAWELLRPYFTRNYVMSSTRVQLRC